MMLKSRQEIDMLFVSTGIVLFIILSSICFADGIAYTDIRKIKRENENLVVKHYHDWSARTSHSRFKMIVTTQNPFTHKNNYSYLECIDKKSEKSIFKLPVPALTYLSISEDSNFIIGLSNIKLHNPFQLVIINRDGKIIKKRHIAKYEVAFSLTEYDAFKKKFQKQNLFLKKLGRIYNVGSTVFVDFFTPGIVNIFGKGCFNYLLEKEKLNHLSRNFCESVSNFVSWYKEPDPQILLKYEGKELVAISLLDPVGERFEISIKE
jgi:hypothetical protein